MNYEILNQIRRQYIQCNNYKLFTKLYQNVFYYVCEPLSFHIVIPSPTPTEYPDYHIYHQYKIALFPKVFECISLHFTASHFSARNKTACLKAIRLSIFLGHMSIGHSAIILLLGLPKFWPARWHFS